MFFFSFSSYFFLTCADAPFTLRVTRISSFFEGLGEKIVRRGVDLKIIKFNFEIILK